MQQLNNFLIKNIKWVSIYLSVIGLLFFTLDLVFYNSETLGLLDSIFNINTVYLNFFNSDFFTYDITIDESSYYSKSVLDPIFKLIFLIGTILYFISNEKEHRLLQFCYLLTFICGLNSAFFILSSLTSMPILTLIIWLTGLAIVMYISFIYLKYWQKNTILAQSTKLIKADETLQVIESSKWQRFLHFVLDSFLIIIIFSYVFFQLTARVLNDTGNALIFISFGSIYFLLSEGIFKISPAKALTQSMVVHEDKAKVSFTRILGRTFARRIPLNPLSFLGKKGWHDDLSKTRVVSVENAKQYNSVYWFILISFLLYIILRVLYLIFDLSYHLH